MSNNNISQGENTKKLPIKPIITAICKRGLIFIPTLLFSGVTFAAETVDLCENSVQTVEVAAKAAEAIRKTELLKKIRTQTGLTVGAVTICQRAAKEAASNGPKSNKFTLALVLLCGFLGGWSMNNLKNGGG